MLKTIKMIALVLVVLVLALLAFAASRPDNFRVERTTTVNAPPEKIFALLNDFRHWPAWSPWEKLDAAMSRSYSGPGSGEGAVYAWSGSGEVGAGRMRIIESTAPTRLVIQLDFTRPFSARHLAEFTIEARGGVTQLSWAMHGRSPLLSKLMQIFISMDRMVGKDFETGLANLKAEAEK